MLLPWPVRSLSERGQSLAGIFNNISLNIKFWKRYNLKQPRLCFKISQGVLEWNINDEANYFIFRYSSFKKIIWCLFRKCLKETMNDILHRGKTLRERILKCIFVCEIHYSKYQLIKSMYKMITSLFL